MKKRKLLEELHDTVFALRQEVLALRREASRVVPVVCPHDHGLGPFDLADDLPTTVRKVREGAFAKRLDPPCPPIREKEKELQLYWLNPYRYFAPLWPAHSTRITDIQDPGDTFIKDMARYEDAMYLLAQPPLPVRKP